MQSTKLTNALLTQNCGKHSGDERAITIKAYKGEGVYTEGNYLGGQFDPTDIPRAAAQSELAFDNNADGLGTGRNLLPP